jgi:hypothetical protein
VLYVEERDGGAAVVYRRLGREPHGPVTVSPPGVTTTAHGEVPPALEVLADGSLFAAYPSPLPGRWKAEIRSQRSRDGGRTWDAPRLVHPPRHGSHSYLSSALLPGGGVALAWLDDRTGGMGLQTATSADGVVFPAAETLDRRTCECCGTGLLAGRGGELWVAYRDADERDVRDVWVLAKPAAAARFAERVPLSADGWTLDGCPHTGPRLAQAADGALWAAWFTGGDPAIYVASSTDGGASFGPRRRLAAPGEGVTTVRHPEIGLLPDGRLAVLYTATRGGGPAGDHGHSGRQDEPGRQRNHPVMARLRDPRSGAWGAPLELSPEGVYPRLAASRDRAAFAFTRRGDDGTQVVVAEWSGGARRAAAPD